MSRGNGLVKAPPPRPQGPDWDKIIELWKHGRPSSTMYVYMPVIVDFRRFCHPCGIGEITLEMLQAYEQTWSHLKRRTINRKMSTVKSLLGFAHRIGATLFDVGRALRLKHAPDDLAEKILPVSDVLRMIDMEPDPRNKVLLRLLYGAGIRASEAAGLRWKDARPRGKNDGQISVLGKGDKSRSIRLSAESWKALMAIQPADCHPDDGIFVSREGRKVIAITRQRVSNIVRTAAQRAGIDDRVTSHWLRHSHATHALDNKAPLILIQRTLGHASLETTSRYLHTNPEDSSSRCIKV